MQDLITSWWNFTLCVCVLVRLYVCIPCQHWASVLRWAGLQQQWVWHQAQLGAWFPAGQQQELVAATSIYKKHAVVQSATAFCLFLHELKHNK